MELLSTIWLAVISSFGLMTSFLIGYTFLNLLPKKENTSVLKKIALSYGLGTGIISISMFLCMIFGMHLRISFIPIIFVSLFLFVY